MNLEIQSIFAQAGSSNALAAVILIAIGFVLGSIVSSISRRITSRDAQPDVIKSSSGAIATLVFSLVLITSLIIALGLINESALDQLITDVALFLPRVISAAIVLIIANIVANVVETGVTRSLGHVSAGMRQRVPKLVKGIIVGFAVVIAANQLGVNTTIVVIAVAAILFGVAASLALLAGLGGRPVAEEVAAGRALRRDLKVGDTVRVGHIEGDVVAIGSTATQITNAQRITLVPNTEMLTQWVEVIQDAQSVGLAPPPEVEE